MKKIFSLLIILIIFPLSSFGYELLDIRKQYDNHFRPYAEATIKNDSFCDIVSIDFIITYSWNLTRNQIISLDPRRKTTRNKIIEEIIPAMSIKTIRFYLPEIDDYEPSSLRINRVKYFNGTVK